VVVAIIVALLAIMVPTMNRAILAAKRVREASSDRQVILGCLAYASDNFNWLPDGQDGNSYNMVWTVGDTWRTLRDDYGIPMDAPVDDFGCFSWDDHEGLFGATRRPWIYWGNRPDIDTPNKPGRSYNFPQRVSDSEMTSGTLLTCYGRKTSHLYKSLVPHLTRYGEVGQLYPANGDWEHPEGYFVGFIGGAVLWVDWDGLKGFTKGANASTFFYAKTW